MEGYRFSTEISVRFAETDAQGIARFNVPEGRGWVYGRYTLPYEELYWNVPLELTGDSTLRGGCRLARRQRRSEVVRIGGGTEPHDLAEDVRTTALRAIPALQHQHCGTFTHDKSIAILIERPAGRFRIPEIR